MSRTDVAIARETARQERTVARRASRRAKFSATAFDRHGYTVGDHETESWDECVDWAKQAMSDNALIAVIDMWEN